MGHQLHIITAIAAQLDAATDATAKTAETISKYGWAAIVAILALSILGMFYMLMKTVSARASDAEKREQAEERRYERLEKALQDERQTVKELLTSTSEAMTKVGMTLEHSNKRLESLEDKVDKLRGP